jgi:hypothetical protein
VEPGARPLGATRIVALPRASGERCPAFPTTSAASSVATLTALEVQLDGLSARLRRVARRRRRAARGPAAVTAITDSEAQR